VVHFVRIVKSSIFDIFTRFKTCAFLNKKTRCACIYTDVVTAPKGSQSSAQKLFLALFFLQYVNTILDEKIICKVYQALHKFIKLALKKLEPKMSFCEQL